MVDGEDKDRRARSPRHVATLVGMAPVAPSAATLEAAAKAAKGSASAEESAPESSVQFAPESAESTLESEGVAGIGAAAERGEKPPRRAPSDRDLRAPRLSDPDLRLHLEDDGRVTLDFEEDELLELPLEERSSDSYPALDVVKVRAGESVGPSAEVGADAPGAVGRSAYRPPAPSDAPPREPGDSVRPRRPILKKRVPTSQPPRVDPPAGRVESMSSFPEPPGVGRELERTANSAWPEFPSDSRWPEARGETKWPDETSGLIKLPIASDAEEDALDLVDRSAPSTPELDFEAEMQERFDLDDFTGALSVAELLLGRDPEHVLARRIAEESRGRLVHMLTSRLGGTDRTPRVVVAESEMRWLGLDHRGGFLLSRIDGGNSIEELLDVCGMPRIEALKTLVELLDAGAIALS